MATTVGATVLPMPAPDAEPTDAALAALAPEARQFVEGLTARYVFTAVELEIVYEAARIRQRLATVRSGAPLLVRDEVALSRLLLSLLAALQVEP